MKRFTRVLRMGLPLVMVLVLAGTLLPASTPTASAEVEQLSFSNIPLPKFGADGGYVLTPNVDLGPIAVSPEGSVMFASANITAFPDIIDLLKSIDGGYTWSLQGGFRMEADAKSDSTSIAAIKVSPGYSNDTTLFVATGKYVYQSVNGGTAFVAMSQPIVWDTDETITDMDVTLDSGGQLSVIIGSQETTGTGDVYVYCPATTNMTWQEQGIGSDVLAVAFSPNFTSDEGIFAVTCNGSITKIQAALGHTDTGGSWGASIGDGEFLDRLGTSIATTTRARITFPDDFDVYSETSNIAFIGLYAGPSDGLNTNEKGDVYKITLTPSASSTVDLNVRGLVSTVPTATNIWSINVNGNATAAHIMVGTDFWSTGVANYYWTAYYSTDGGQTWFTAGEKSPTGGTLNYTGSPATLTSGTTGTIKANVLMHPDFVSNKTAWAATQGSHSSAFSRTINGGQSWNQISLIDYANTTDYYTVKWVHTDIRYGQSASLYMVTAVRYIPGWFESVTGGAVWKTTNGGANYERIWSYANPTATDTIDRVIQTKEYLPQDPTVFAVDRANGKFWRSSDGGATFPTIVTAPSGLLTTYTILDPNTIWTANYYGDLWHTTNLGQSWLPPDESIITGYYPTLIQIKGDIVLVSTRTGKVFISTDAGQTFTSTLGITDLSGYVGVNWDNNYATNHYVYASIGTYGGGIWRIEVNEEAPGSTEWQRIDADSPGADSVVIYTAFQLLGDTLYCYDYMSVNTAANTGGLWRSPNPSADIDGVYPPVFEKVQVGLPDGISMGIAGWSVYPNTVFMNNRASVTPANYYNQLFILVDTSTFAEYGTPAGDNITVSDPYSGVTIEFDSVSEAGITGVDVSEENPGDTTSEFRFLDKYYDIYTDASYSGNVTVTIAYDEADVSGNETDLRLFHWNGTEWVLVELQFVDTDNNTITGVVDSLCYFVIGGPNDPPVAEATGTPYLAAVEAQFTFDGSASYDPDGTLVSYEWDFGDETSGSGSTVSHTYDTPGLYYVVLTATDDTGAQSADSVLAVVYDPNVGFATGGGWFWSGKGNLKKDFESEGKATFGFVVKYKQEAAAGNLEFHYRIGDINLKSSDITWLVVSSTSAQFQGVGTINGEGLYTFRVSAQDSDQAGGHPDEFTIRIWESTDTEADPIYQAIHARLGGGNIIVHTK